MAVTQHKQRNGERTAGQQTVVQLEIQRPVPAVRFDDERNLWDVLM